VGLTHRQFLASPSKKGSGSEPVAGPSRSNTPGAADIVDLADLDDDVEWTDENDFRPPDQADPPSLKRKAEALDKQHLLGPICPICSKALGPSTSNQGLNEHIDSCLNKDAIREAGKRSPKKSRRDVGDKPGGSREKGKGQAKKGSMMAWLNRSG
jgi:DNA polymerase kappa